MTAVVVVRPGHSVTAEEVIAACRENLAAYKAPKDVHFVDESRRAGSARSSAETCASDSGPNVGGGWLSDDLDGRSMDGSTDPVLYEVHGAVAWLRLLHRPDALNALAPEIVARLRRGLDVAEADGAVRAVVITGTGRAFCAGADIAVGESAEDPARAVSPDFLQDRSRDATSPRTVSEAGGGRRERDRTGPRLPS